MKKIIGIITSAIVLIIALALCFSGCNVGNTGTAITDAPISVPTKAPSEVPADAPAQTPSEAPTQAPTQAPTPTQEPTASPEPSPANIAKGTNVAPDAEVEVSSTTGTSHVQWGWSYEFINDGIIIDQEAPSLGWTTAVGVNMDDPNQEEWAEFHLDKYTLVDKVIVYPTIGGSYFPVDFEIQVSLNGKDYTTVAKVEGDTHAAKADTTPVTMEFEAVLARYVKFVATKLHNVPSSLGDGILVQVAEIEIYAA